MTKKIIQQDEEWGNIELPGLSDEELFNINWNRRQGNREAAVTREQSEDFKRKRLEGIRKSLTNPEVRKNFILGNGKKFEDPNYWAAYYEGIKKRDSNPEYHKKRIQASNQTLGIKVQTPLGIFDTISDAARAHNLTSEGMRHRVNSDRYPDYKKIEK